MVGATEPAAGGTGRKVRVICARRFSGPGAGWGVSYDLKMELSSDPRLLRVVRSAVQQLAQELGLDEPECHRVTLAVDEAVTNIIRHAYQNEPGQPIEITCSCRGPSSGGDGPDRLEILLQDCGRGVHPSELRGRPLDEVRPGGLGLHLIHEAMDEVEYQRAGQTNRLRLVKYLRKKDSH